VVLELAKFVLEDGTELSGWDSYSIASDFLTPTDGWSVQVCGRNKIDQFLSLLQPDTKVQAWVDGQRVLTGFVDSTSIQSDMSGTRLTVQGRDILKPLCKANIHPSFRVKGITLADMVAKVIDAYYMQDKPDLYYDNEANRQVLDLKPGKGKDRSAQQKKVIDYCQAHPNEGAFEFVSRNLRRFGLWIWATADGNIVIGGPDYAQEPSYEIQRHTDQTGTGYISATYGRNLSNVPTYLEVRGKSTQKEWDKKTVAGWAQPWLTQYGEVVVSGRKPDYALYNQRSKWYIEPAYIQHDQAETSEQAQDFAFQEMTRLRQDEESYTVTAIGHRDRATGNLFAVDTTANVSDQYCNVEKKMWVSSRTFRGSVDGGTTTELTLQPLYSIQLSDIDVP